MGIDEKNYPIWKTGYQDWRKHYKASKTCGVTASISIHEILKKKKEENKSRKKQ